VNLPESTVRLESSERQLFVDDFVIAETVGLRRTLHRPIKKGAVIRPNYPAGEHNVQTRAAPVWDPRAKTYKLVTLGKMYESRDGLHWSEIGSGPHIPKHMVYDGAAPDPGRRFKGLRMRALFKVEEVLDNRGRVKPGKELRWELQPVVSGDAITWTELDVPGIPSKDETNLSFSEKKRLFIAVVKMRGRFGRSHAISTSSDFEKWTDPKLVFQADEFDQVLDRDKIQKRMFGKGDRRLSITCYKDPAAYKVDVYNMSAFRYESIYIGLPAIHPSTALEMGDLSNNVAYKVVQLTCSRDLTTWKRVGDRQPFIDLSPKESSAYDRSVSMPASWPIVRNDELWFYYSGGKYCGWPPTESDHKYWRLKNQVAPNADFDVAKEDLDRGAICLAVLRRDGFVSLDANADGGSVVTKPLRIPNGKLFVNARLAPEGELRVAVLDRNALPLKEGFGVATCRPVTGDQTRVQVVWKNAEGFMNLGEREVRLRFALRSGELYSFWVER